MKNSEEIVLNKMCPKCDQTLPNEFKRCCQTIVKCWHVARVLPEKQLHWQTSCRRGDESSERSLSTTQPLGARKEKVPVTLSPSPGGKVRITRIENESFECLPRILRYAARFELLRGKPCVERNVVLKVS